MGTSQSKPDAPPVAPLIPPWADQDPAPFPPAPEPDAPQQNDQFPLDTLPAQPEPPPSDVALPRRYAGFRSALGRFAASGDRREARTALGHWTRTSIGGSRAGVARVKRAARTGGAAIAGLSRAGSGLQPVEGALDVRTLTGLAVDRAIDQIVDTFCQPGILDEDITRLAIGEALATALSGVDTFDPDAVDSNTVRIVTLTFAAELVFVQIAGDGGQWLASAPTPAVAVEREAELRSLVREVTDIVGSPLLVATGSILTPDAIASLVSHIVEEVEREMLTW